MSWVAVGMVGASLVGGAVASDQAGKKQSAANADRQQALAQYANINTPDVDAQKLMLQDYINTGVMNPQLEQLVGLGPSAMQGIALNPAMRQKQMDALEQMSGLAQGKVSSGDIAGFELAKRDAAGYDQAKQNQILQEMQQRGQGGSGAELLARLKSTQSGADRLQQADLEQAKRMQDARQQALMQQSNMAGNLRTQDYGEQSNLAKAQDMIAQFNAQNAQGLNTRNNNTSNDAQRLNLQNAQNNSNMNTELHNKQQINNKGLLQQQFNNQMSLAGGKAGQYSNQATANDQQAAQTAGMWSGIGQGVATGIGSTYGNSKNNKSGYASTDTSGINDININSPSFGSSGIK
jgi:hypothetical protein